MPILTLDQKLDIRKKRRIIRDHQRKQKKLQSIWGDYKPKNPRQTSFLDLPGAFSDSPQDDDHIHQVKDKQGPYPFQGAICNPRRPNETAHGGTRWLYVCRCGASKEVNHNSGQKEHGQWMVTP